MEDKKKSKIILMIGLVIFILIVLIILIFAIKLIFFNDTNLEKYGGSQLNSKNAENDAEYNNTIENNYKKHNVTPMDIMKPIIYIYPTEASNITIKLGNPQYLSCTYPKYTNGWNVTAYPDGTLIDISNNRKLYALYWEGKGIPKSVNMDEGFCIKGEDTIKFLEEKLAILGLNERESEEFIIYWLPKMEHNKYNYIRFETIEEQNNAMPLEINPKPESLIRIMMDWKGLENKIEVKEQILNTPKREGYTVVEWGGSELN